VLSARDYEDQVRPFLVRHCLECHGGERAKGDFRIDQLTAGFADDQGRERWQTVCERLKAGAMPPKSKPRPPKDQVQVVTAWIGGIVDTAEAAERTTRGRRVLRRLNRVEYENTVRDLLGVASRLNDPFPLSDLYLSMHHCLGIESDRFGSSTGTLTGLEPSLEKGMRR
jgi:hypothetical protein